MPTTRARAARTSPNRRRSRVALVLDHRTRARVRHHAACDPLLRRPGHPGAGPQRCVRPDACVLAARPHAAEADAARQAARACRCMQVRELIDMYESPQGRDRAGEAAFSRADPAPRRARAAARGHPGHACRDRAARSRVPAPAGARPALGRSTGHPAPNDRPDHWPAFLSVVVSHVHALVDTDEIPFCIQGRTIHTLMNCSSTQAQVPAGRG